MFQFLHNNSARFLVDRMRAPDSREGQTPTSSRDSHRPPRKHSDSWATLTP
ncbi:hypothetical protein HMPREF1980_00656 [Actinomyces sp. oral taxon 172 str. F0311]|nr:hypothetical protein HMPREF1980_00656 [Actinomyces sp. oral taxon 172 str. F0311]